MLKTTLSGLVVNADEYYMLLEWKDAHHEEFGKFLDSRGLLFPSINTFNQVDYDAFVIHVKNLTLVEC